MDMNKRDELIEKRNKLSKDLRSTYKQILKESWGLVKVKEEEEDPVVDPSATDAPAPVDVTSPEVPATTPDASAEGAAADPQAKLATTDFVTKYLKGLPSDVNIAESVNENGIFNASVNDDQSGQFMVVTFPATMTIQDVANILQPVDSAIPGASGAMVPDAAPVADPALDAPVGDVAPSDDAAPVDDTELKEEEVCNSDDKAEQDAADREKQRDPMMEGRKSWKSFQAGRVQKFNEQNLEALKKELEGLKKWLADETDPEEKEELKKKIEKLKGKLSSSKISSDSKEKHKVTGHKSDEE